MAARITQQIVWVAYTTSPAIRVTALRAEVVRSESGSAYVVTAKQPVIFLQM